ncbi:MAG: hypothetical protein WC679_13725 [Bacteroidales bacterium]|jgi:hypothetical protein
MASKSHLTYLILELRKRTDKEGNKLIDKLVEEIIWELDAVISCFKK